MQRHGRYQGTTTLYEPNTVWGCGYATPSFPLPGYTAKQTSAVKLLDDDGPKVTKIVTSFYTAIVLREDGSVYGCGKNASYHLGLPAGDVATWRQIGAGSNWIDIALTRSSNSTGSDQTLWMLKEDGSVWGMGYSSTSLCLGVSTTNVQTLSLVSSGPFTKIFGGGQGLCYALDVNGAAYVIGAAGHAAQPAGLPKANTATFRQIGTDSGYIQIACTLSSLLTYATILLKEDGTLWGVGTNTSSVIAPGTTLQNTPVQIETASNWVKIFGGHTHNFYALDSDGHVWGRGASIYVEGSATPSNKTVLTKISDQIFTDFSVANNYVIGAISDGRAVTMGNNNTYGGNGMGVTSGSNAYFVALPNLSNVVAVVSDPTYGYNSYFICD